MLDKTFEPHSVEGRIYQAWEKSGAFAAGRRPEAKPFTIVIPPPNVTGSLHMGHALNNTLQDILVRFERLRGRDALWQPGTDHAGIATQMVVERQLAAEGSIRREDMGRAAFIERVWTWKEKSGGAIINQLRRLGASCDWSRERFTMDEGLSRAVVKVFVQLYREGLIYKDKRLVNWDPKLLTAISDLEVQQIEVNGHLWHIRYPIEHTKDFIVVATTRPETMLGDVAVAVHPENERLKRFIGKKIILPLVNRPIPVIGDEYADPEKGTGAVKITPAHDFNDFEVGRRHNLPSINIFDRHARLDFRGDEAFNTAPAEILALHGMDRFEARKEIAARLEKEGLLEKTESHTHVVPHGDRSDVVIEPYLTDQWYVNARKLAEPAIRAVEGGQTVFVPAQWEKTYFAWMRDIQPWCISRQLWWGHRIPAWYADDGGIFVAESETEARKAATEHYGTEVRLERDPDVLDTWFSSALWPFSTLGWPDQTAELKRHYKTDVLVTGFDIIFFWVARMMMMGLHFMGKVPFHTVYIHALVRDEKGQKMAKSKGNVIDPLQLIDHFGADALRFTLAAMAAQGRDIRLSESRVEGYRNFGTKLWNAARFCQINECVRVEGFEPLRLEQAVNRWMAGEVLRAANVVTRALEDYRFNDAAHAIYHFIWHIFCDWYLEFIKPLLNGRDKSAKSETRAMAAWTVDQILVLLHPFMPFITEELWVRLGEYGPQRNTMLVLASWPSFQRNLTDQLADEEMNWLIALISAVRSLRTEMNVPAGAKLPLYLKDADGQIGTWVTHHQDIIKSLARVERTVLLRRNETLPKGAVQHVLGQTTLLLPLGEVIDLVAERERLEGEIARMEGEIAKIDLKLANTQFVSRAPNHVIEEQRGRRLEAEQTRLKLQEALSRLAAVR
jgi:valyl-tRNA synthetase